MSGPGGLIFVSGKATASSKTNKLYSEECIPKLDPHSLQGTSQFILRYRNTDPDAKSPFLTLLPVEDVNMITSEEAGKWVEGTWQSQVASKATSSHLELDSRPYEKIQTYEGYQAGDKIRGETLVSVAMEPDDDADFDEWYRKQHLDMLGMCRGYIRGTRWKRLDGNSPRFIALHEYDCKPEDLPVEQLKQVTSSEWSKKIIGTSKIMDRIAWKLVHTAGDGKLRL